MALSSAILGMISGASKRYSEMEDQKRREDLASRTYIANLIGKDLSSNWDIMGPEDRQKSVLQVADILGVKPEHTATLAGIASQVYPVMEQKMKAIPSAPQATPPPMPGATNVPQAALAPMPQLPTQAIVPETTTYQTAAEARQAMAMNLAQQKINMIKGLNLPPELESLALTNAIGVGPGAGTVIGAGIRGRYGLKAAELNNLSKWEQLKGKMTQESRLMSDGTEHIFVYGAAGFLADATTGQVFNEGFGVSGMPGAPRTSPSIAPIPNPPAGAGISGPNVETPSTGITGTSFKFTPPPVDMGKKWEGTKLTANSAGDVTFSQANQITGREKNMGKKQYPPAGNQLAPPDVIDNIADKARTLNELKDYKLNAANQLAVLARKKARGEDWEDELTPAGSAAIVKIQPVRQRFEELKRVLEPVKNDNTAWTHAADRLGYALGWANDASPLIAQMELAKIQGSLPYMSGMSRNYKYIEDVQQHLPKVGKDSPKLLYEKITNALRAMNDITAAITKYQVKHPAVGGSPSTTKPMPAPPIGTVVDGYKFKGGDPANKANWEKSK